MTAGEGRLARLRIAAAYRWRHGRWPDLDAPRRFTEWVQWRKLHERDVALDRLTDKLHAKTLAAAALGAHHVVPTLMAGRDLPNLPVWPLPLVVKANHGCNQFVIVRNLSDWARARAAVPSWLARDYGRWLDEPAYRAARRLVLVEPYLGGPGAPLPIDYKVYVFGGRAELVQVHTGRSVKHRWTQFDRDWRPLSADPVDARPPATLSAMLRAAEMLAADQSFLRVDFYEVGGTMWFGEFCLYPGSGLDPVRAAGLDERLGDLWAAAQSRLVAQYSSNSEAMTGLNGNQDLARPQQLEGVVAHQLNALATVESKLSPAY